jgi:hypothetical protein
MKTKKSTSPAAGPKFAPAPGVGFDATPDASGYGLRNEPAVALCIHAVYGTRAHGPFVSLDAARLWIDRESDETLVGCYGTNRGWTIHATTMEVPAVYR